MKKMIIASCMLFIALSSCKKDKPDEEIKPVTGTVQIESKTYSTVVIGDLEWMSQNYDGSVGVYYNGTTNSTYGKLLTLKQTKRVVLPAGWRIPTVSDYVNLINSQGGFVSFNTSQNIGFNILEQPIKKEAVNKLISTSIGFNAVLAGYGLPNNQYAEVGVFGTLWTSNVYQQGNIYYPAVLGLDPTGDDSKFAEFAQPLQSATEDSRGKASIRFVRNKQ